MAIKERSGIAVGLNRGHVSITSALVAPQFSSSISRMIKSTMMIKNNLPFELFMANARGEDIRKPKPASRNRVSHVPRVI